MAKNKLSRDLKRYENRVLDEIKRIVKETTLLLEKELKERMPVDTSEMVNSISVDFSPDGLNAKLQIGSFYAIYVNYGTGIYAEGPGGSKAKSIPWTYYSPRYGRWITTHGQRAQYFWEDSLDVVARFFVSEMNKLSK